MMNSLEEYFYRILKIKEVLFKLFNVIEFYFILKYEMVLIIYLIFDVILFGWRDKFLKKNINKKFG